MNVPVIFHRLAILELRKAVKWYTERSASAPARLLTAIDLLIAL